MPLNFLDSHYKQKSGLILTKYFEDAVFHQKSKNYDAVSLLYLWLAQKTHSLHEILTGYLLKTGEKTFSVSNQPGQYFT